VISCRFAIDIVLAEVNCLDAGYLIRWPSSAIGASPRSRAAKRYASRAAGRLPPPDIAVAKTAPSGAARHR
jgi:hypothetical protein